MTTHDRAPRRRLPRRFVVALALVAVGVVGLTAASAARLGVDASGRDGVAAGSANVTSCDAAVDATLAGYGWDAANQRFTANRVTVSNIDAACSGRTVEVAVVNGSGRIVGVGSATVNGTSTAVPVTTLTNPTAVRDIHVVIS